MKPKAHQHLTITSVQDHQRRFPACPEGSWWQDAPREAFTARAIVEVPRMSLAKYSGVIYEGMGDANIRKALHKQRAYQDHEV